ncbi:MAG: NlpC/P60 family protein [Saccharofermentanales bacterium]
MRKNNFAQKTLILLVLFALVFGSVFTEQVKAEPLDANEAENSEAALTEADLSAEAEPGSSESDNVEPELETPATIASDSDQETNEESNQEVNEVVSTERESEAGAVGSETVDNELLPEPGIEETIESTDGATEPTEKAPEPTEEAIEPTEETIEPEDEVAESAEVAAESTGETESTKQTSDNTEELPMLNKQRNGGTISQATIESAINWSNSKMGSRNWNGLCLKFVNDAYQASGIHVTRYYDAKIAGDHLITNTDHNPPRGAYVFYDSPKQPHGHVSISLGNGQVIHAYGSVQVGNLIPYSHLVYRGWGFVNGMTPENTQPPTTGNLDDIVTGYWVEGLTATDATFRTAFHTAQRTSSFGCYFGSDPNNLTHKEETYPNPHSVMYYNCNKWFGALQPDTTYYYKFYAVIGGTRYDGSLQSFRTASTTGNLDDIVTGYWVEGLTATDATFRTAFHTAQRTSSFGCYFGSDPNNLTHKEETYPNPHSVMYYNCNKWFGALQPDTTYYYKFYAVIGGTRYDGSLQSFTTPAIAPTSANLTVSSNSVTEGETLTFTASGDNNPEKYTIGIDKDSERVLTQDMAEGVLSINTLVAGEYTAYVTAANSAGSTDSARITFTVVEAKPVIVRGYIYANSIIRSAPNGNIITKLWRPILITGTIEGAWLKFTYNGRTAYVAAKLVTNRNPAMTGYAKQKLYVRNTPNGAVTDTILRGTQVKGVLVGNMVRFTHKGKTAYVYAVLLQKNPVRATTYILANSIIRSAPNGSIVSRPWRPFLVTGIIEGAWFKFTYNGSTAYVALRSTTTRNPVISGYAKQKLYVRNTPNGSVTDTILRGTQVKGVLVGNMVRFTHKGKTAYVYAVLLQKNPVPAKTTRYIYANSIIRSSPNGSIVTRPWRPLRVSGTIQGTWFKFTYNGKPAYVAIRSTTTRNPVMTGYAKQKLYVRNTPNGSVVTTVPKGYRVSGVLVGNMVRFTYNGRTAYVYAVFLRK